MQNKKWLVIIRKIQEEQKKRERNLEAQLYLELKKPEAAVSAIVDVLKFHQTGKKKYLGNFV